MSNRDIVLEILLKCFSDYQLIILTHDKPFFEMAKQKFNSKANNQWKYFEMYVDSSNNFEKPLILQHKTYFQKAEYYLIKHDYSVCANYLRKEAERLLKKLVCKGLTCDEVLSLQEMINKAKSKGYIKNERQIIERVEKLVNNKEFIKFDKAKISCKQDKTTIGEVQSELKEIKRLFGKTDDKTKDLNEILTMLEQFKSLILNPQSHDDEIQVYKKELEDTIKIIKQLKELLSD